MTTPHIVAVEWARLEGRRPRHAGRNARLGEHGVMVRVPILRITAEDGSSGFGAYHGSPERVRELLGVAVDDLFTLAGGVPERWLPFEYAIWDLAGARADQPVYALVARMAGRAIDVPFRAPCYDTSLYFDDLHLAEEQAAAELIAAEARAGYERGHRAFKIKVGRGARHMPLDEGTRRDIAIVRAVRAAIGPAAPIMLDANNGYNLNLTKRVLSETADCGIVWIEEPFHEDEVLYRDLREWLANENLRILIADGEGQADPRLIAWARAGLIDVIQYDIFGYGFARWLALGREFDGAGVRSAPHHYGGHYGNYAAGHLAAAIERFAFVEWDEATTPGIGASGYELDDGWVTLPQAPGFGLALDQAAFESAMAQDGFRRSL
ncbi:MAG TPA: enolase C-terminal domain-like protein [Roseiflexaceae bacterium]|nr:enolase C-terminal domain-like protein [Roseiflexaceae bacterium]